MNDYIKRKDALECVTYDEEYTTEQIKALPAADVVPVVRCRECIHHHYESTDIPYCDMIDYGYGWKDNDFCSRGEKKE